jgi:hypothetical protein
MEILRSSETSANFYWSTRHHIHLDQWQINSNVGETGKYSILFFLVLMDLIDARGQFVLLYWKGRFTFGARVAACRYVFIPLRAKETPYFLASETIRQVN